MPILLPKLLFRHFYTYNMGLFNDTDDSGRQDEVVIDAPADNSDKSEETRLGQQVEDSLVGGDQDSGTEKSTGSSDVNLDDIHRQNETIIDLLEKLVDQKDSGNSNSRSRGNNSDRVTDRGSKSTSRVTDRKDSSDNNSVGDGMNELL